MTNDRPSISIVIVNYRTPKQTRLCMRSLRRYTRYEPLETIVVENSPGDESADYLEGLPWIRYLRNEHEEPNHRNGLDFGISRASGEWILAMHTDTFVRREGWLVDLSRHLTESSWLVGSQDRVIQPVTGWGRFDARRRRRKLERRWGEKGQIPKIISHCAFYRRALFTEREQRFDWPEYIDGVYNDCGEFIQRYCESEGLGVVYLRREELAPSMWHFEAATLNLVTGRRVPWKRRLRSRLFYRRADVRSILEDDSLDR